MKNLAHRCPACGNQAIFVGSGGLLTCSWLGCPDPVAVGRAIRYCRGLNPERIPFLLETLQAFLETSCSAPLEFYVQRVADVRNALASLRETTAGKVPAQPAKNVQGELANELAAIRAAFEPVADWFGDDGDHEPPPLPDMIRDAVAELQRDRETVIAQGNVLRAIMTQVNQWFVKQREAGS